jgi:hypothetical protein
MQSTVIRPKCLVEHQSKIVFLTSEFTKNGGAHGQTKKLCLSAQGSIKNQTAL